MSEEITVKADALEPLFEAWEEPSRRRVRAASGEGAEVRNQRRPSPINAGMVQNLRAEVKGWRDNYYFGASDTSRHLLNCRFGRAHRVTAALGITEEEDALCRSAFKMATGSGKTKVMSLAIVWSYFHALRESESPMARHFVVIAPNLTVDEYKRNNVLKTEVTSRDVAKLAAEPCSPLLAKTMGAQIPVDGGNDRVI